MSKTELKEYVICSVCKRPVVKQKFCNLCGNVLIREVTGPEHVDEHKEEVKSNAEEALKVLKEKNISMEDERKEAIKHEESEAMDGSKDPQKNEAFRKTSMDEQSLLKLLEEDKNQR